METTDNKQKNKRALRNSFLVFIAGVFLFSISVPSLFSLGPNNFASTTILIILAIILGLIGGIMTIINGIKFLRK